MDVAALKAPARFFFKPEFVQELRDLSLLGLRLPRRYLALIAQGDEVLGWCEMGARDGAGYAGAHLHLLEGGDHATSDFAQHLPAGRAVFGLGLTDLRGKTLKAWPFFLLPHRAQGFILLFI